MPPDRVWRLTPRDLMIAHAAIAPASFDRLRRSDLNTLMAAYPDERPIAPGMRGQSATPEDDVHDAE